jgi:short-subunit dehydrogenase
MNVIITGASKGLGLAIADIFAAEGHTLFICSRNAVQLEAARQQLLQYGNEVYALPADLSDILQVQAFAGFCLERGVPYVLVNNAGSFLPGSLRDEANGTLEKMLQANLYSAYHLTKALLPVMIEHRYGHIFNMCSTASVSAYPNGGSYSISKFALYGFSKNLREELKPHQIKVTHLIPGAVYTDSWAGSGVDPERIMQARDIAAMVYAAAQLSPQACVEELVFRPQLGDL